MGRRVRKRVSSSASLSGPGGGTVCPGTPFTLRFLANPVHPSQPNLSALSPPSPSWGFGRSLALPDSGFFPEGVAGEFVGRVNEVIRLDGEDGSAPGRGGQEGAPLCRRETPGGQASCGDLPAGRHRAGIGVGSAGSRDGVDPWLHLVCFPRVLAGETTFQQERLQAIAVSSFCPLDSVASGGTWGLRGSLHSAQGSYNSVGPAGTPPLIKTETPPQPLERAVLDYQPSQAPLRAGH